MPIIATNPKFSNSDHTTIEGAIGVIVNVTELKEREQDVKVHVREKRQYMAKEAAAKEASRLKSQFLANVRLWQIKIQYIIILTSVDVSRDPNTDHWSPWNDRATSRFNLTG